MGNVMVIPAKRQVGNNIKKAEKQSSELQRTAASVLTAMSRPPAMKLRSNITLSASPRTLNG